MSTKSILLTLLLIIFIIIPSPGQQSDNGLFSLSLEELMELEITTAGKKEEKISEIPASVVVITREEIEKYGFITLDEILENIPGMFMINDYSWDGHYKFGVRGFWSNITNEHLKIFVNGINQQDNLHGNFPLDKIGVPVECIDRIEVIRGPMSVIYGNGAFFGTINIITNHLPDYGNEQVYMSFGNKSTMKTVFRSGDENGEYNYTLNMGYYETNGIDKPYSKMVEPEILVNMPTSGTGDLLEENTKYMNFSGKFKGLYADFGFVESNNEFVLIEPSFKKGSLSKYISSTIVTGYRGIISDNTEIDARLTYSATNNKLDYDFYYETSFIYQVLQAESIELDANIFYRPNPTLHITFGANYRSASDVESRVHIPSSGWGQMYNLNSEVAPGDHIVTQSIFCQADYKPADDIKLTGGLRLEQMPRYTIRRVDATDSLGVPPLIITGDHKDDDIYPVFRLAGLYNINKNNIIKLLYGQAINMPSFWYLHAVLLYGEPNLKTEKVSTYEVNYLGMISSSLSFNASLFYNQLDNLIVREHGLDEEGNYYDIEKNSGRMNTMGTELMLRYKPDKNLNIELGCSYQDTKDENTKEEPAYSPQLLGYFKAYYMIEEDISFAITGNYVDEMQPFMVMEPDAPNHRISPHTSPAYFSMGSNLRVNNIIYDNLSAGIRISNILDTDIKYPTYNNNQIFQKGTLGFGRRIMLNLSWKF